MICAQALLTLLLISPCSEGGGTPARESVAAAIANVERPAGDRERDELRHPAEVLTFFGIEPGMRVLDLFSGGGYYTEILSHLVGAAGAVVAHNNEAYLDFAGEELAGRFTPGRLPNVERITAEASDLQLEPASFDAALAVLTWHDFYYADPENGWPAIDEPSLTAKLCTALKPGAVLGVVDHVAASGSDPRQSGQTLHRIDPERIKADLRGSCFVFDGELSVLRNPDDDHSLTVFDPAIRGRTDQIVYCFRRK